VYLQAPAEWLRRRYRRLAHADPDAPAPMPEYLKEVAEAYNHFFFHYAATPLLVVETSQVDPAWPDESVDEILRQLQDMPGGTRYVVPRGV
jgi:deoxyadenosine/deoxycytidine kinase